MFRERTEFEADRIRTKLLKEKPVHTETLEVIQEETNNNPQVAFEKYKDFVKKFHWNCWIAYYNWRRDYYHCAGNEKGNKESRKHNTESRIYCGKSFGSNWRCFGSDFKIHRESNVLVWRPLDDNDWMYSGVGFWIEEKVKKNSFIDQKPMKLHSVSVEH